MPIAIPDPKPIKDLFESLLGRDVSMLPLDKPVVPTARRACCVGLYVDTDQNVKALVAADLPLAARAGAALGLVPKAGADTAIENDELPAALYDNFYEVMNIFSSLFNVGDPEDHLKLSQVFQPGMVIPTDAAKMLRGLGKRADFTLSVDGYGDGALGVVVPF
ncbi:Uncharacterised protein [Dermatophilus congolensis]|uniref:Chemotaxis phosphatase CheX-like domain-containing protein n=1 Tax=Dermatophilus congolensis TaxID=1863 RepID=A0A239VVT2_9MICO|nr:hypothetical protein [Dermatophilus congolensis]SNV25850.1 Uncharacterised protein [Dermatophilus congolensis]